MKCSEQKHDVATQPLKDNGPQYPYGLQVRLDEESIKKLGIQLPAVGDKMKLVAVAEVYSVSDHKSVYGQNRAIELQITDMALSSSKES